MCIRDRLVYTVENQLGSVYEQILKLLKSVLSIPVMPASTEHSMSTLKRIKTCLCNAMKNKRPLQLTIYTKIFTGE